MTWFPNLQDLKMGTFDYIEIFQIKELGRYAEVCELAYENPPKIMGDLKFGTQLRIQSVLEFRVTFTVQ